MCPIPARVRRRRRDGPDTWTLELDAGSAALAAFQPGQFNMLYVFGVGEIPISFSGDAAEPERLVHTVRSVGAVSRALAGLRPGDTVGLRGPFGAGWPLAAAVGRNVVLVAGGLGLAPLRPALYALLREPGRYGRVTVLYGTRRPEDILYRAELEAWSRRDDLALRITVDHAGDEWLGRVGVVTGLIPAAVGEPAATVAFVCGPEPMMRFAAAALRDSGLAADAIHLSMERNMKCAIGHCGHCQLGAAFVCKDGPVLPWTRLAGRLAVKEL